jgi:hypothetical protein
MNPKMRRNFSGEFRALDLGSGAWRLTCTAPHEVDVYLQGAEQRAAQAFGAVPIADLGIEWHTETALLSFAAGDRIDTVESASAIVHEPLGHLYDGLPLMSFDADARRFWRRVFGLVRIPGGRYLLRFLSRPARRSP